MTSRPPAAAVLAALSVLALGSTTLAGDPLPGFSMTFDAAGDGAGETGYHWDWFGDSPVFGLHAIGGLGDFTGWSYASSDTSVGAWEFSWNVVFSGADSPSQAGAGAFVAANIVVTNNNVFTDNFSTQFVVGLEQAILSPTMRGAVNGTLTELTFDSATVSAPESGQIYTPRIDGLDESGGYLMQAPYSESALALQQTIMGPESFGQASPIAASRDAASTIGLILDFDLSAGDSVSLNAIFELVPVPAPGALPLLALLALRRSRRRA